jgi:hypothetical protein
MNKKLQNCKKTKYIKVLVSEEQKAEIETNARKCNKSTSRFLCERGLGYNPKHYLTNKEFELLEDVQTLLKEIIRFTSVISGKAKGLKDPKARMTFLTQMGITKTWKSKIDIVVEYLYSFIENINFKHHYNYDR